MKILYICALHYYFEENKFISPVQFGFCERSNITVVVSSLDNKHYASCIFIDMTKEFDTVDRSLLKSVVENATHGWIYGGGGNKNRRPLKLKNKSARSDLKPCIKLNQLTL